MAEFPHLKLPFKVEGVIKPSKRGFPPNEHAQAITNANKQNREGHGKTLTTAAKTLLENWEGIKSSLEKKGIKLPNKNDIPVFLKIDTSSFPIDSLLNWGIDVISEEGEGYVLGASIDGLNTFQENVEAFMKEQGMYKNTAAKIWEFITDDSLRVSHLLKGEISKIWNKIDDTILYTVELAVSCNVQNTKSYPDKSKFDSEVAYKEAINDFKDHELELQVERDLRQMKRQGEVEDYLKIYNGELEDIWDVGTDAVYFKISVNGGGLKDIVQTYQYLFEVKLDGRYSIEAGMGELDGTYHFNLLPPPGNAPAVCVIDSGIQESHRLLAPAIDVANSRSYVDGDDSKSDFVERSGHGTKVAGAILYPNSIPTAGEYQLVTKIQNARILDKRNRISKNKFAPTLLEQINTDYSGTRIFNLSVSDDDAYIGTHMPSLAASIDKLTHENDILFIVAAGNIFESSNLDNNPGIKEHLQSGNDYPNYLSVDSSKIACPGVSYFGITVGSIGKEDFENDDYKALAGKDKVSPFSRTGLGMWGCIKPDVVEFGGDLAKNKNSIELIKPQTLLPELVNSTLHGANAVGRHSCGTSFSVPKVSYIASRLQAEHPEETAQMYRALIIQSARLPEHCFNNPKHDDIRHYGYGLPNLDRALNNYEQRITFIQSGTVGPKKADIYHLKIPSELKGEGKNFRILVEVTLSFTAKTRVTRRGSHSYLSSWLEWQSSKYNENFKSFRSRTIDYLEQEDSNSAQADEGLNAIKWCLRENSAWANNRINRNNSTVQKSWVIIEPHQFAEEFSIAVIGHAGWDKNLENEISYSLCVSFEVLDIEMNIYNVMAEAQIETQLEVEF